MFPYENIYPTPVYGRKLCQSEAGVQKMKTLKIVYTFRNHKPIKVLSGKQFNSGKLYNGTNGIDIFHVA